jgi:YfiH family protein
MPVDICPIFNDLHWINHRYFGRQLPVTNKYVGIQKFGQFDGPVFFMPQTHSATIITPDEPLPESGADAVITAQTHIGLAVKSADCIPLLVVCTTSRLIGAIHAGWAGTLKNIVPLTIQRLIDQGARAETIRVGMGPSLQALTFPVRDDLYEQFKAKQPESLPYFKPVADHYLLDLHGIIERQLREADITQIWQSRKNVFSSPESYFSYRRRHDDPIHTNNRNVSVIMRTK